MLSFKKYISKDHTNWAVFIHGAGGSSNIWYKQVADFRKEFNVLLIDLRGHGASAEYANNIKGDYSFEAVGDDVIQILDELKIDRASFVGISLGSMIIRDLSHRYPERVQSMILGGAILKINLRGQILMNLGLMLKSLIPWLYLYRIFAYVIMPRRNHKESRNLFIKEAEKIKRREFLRWFDLVRRINTFLSQIRQSHLKQPALYIMGEEDHMFLPYIKKYGLSPKLSMLHVIPDCGHVVNVEKPLIFNEISLAFLKSKTDD